MLCAQYSWQLVAECGGSVNAVTQGWDDCELLRLLTRYMARAERHLWLDLPAPALV